MAVISLEIEAIGTTTPDCFSSRAWPVSWSMTRAEAE